jgi:hypothetical protein
MTAGVEFVFHFYVIFDSNFKYSNAANELCQSPSNPIKKLAGIG